MTAASTPTPPAMHGARHIVLIGAGAAHLQVLAQLAAQPLAGTVVTLVTPYSHQMVERMVPGFMVGRSTPDTFTIALQPLVQRGGTRWITQNVTSLDVAQQTIQLDDGKSLRFDWLSINPSPSQDRAQVELTIPGAREHALFVRPLGTFATLWPRVTELGDSRALRIAVIGAGAGGIEMAFAVRQRLAQAAVTLLSGHAPPAARFSQAVQQRVTQLLKKHNITVLNDVATGIKAGFVQLGCGADLACDVPLLATGSLPAPWLADSALALDEHGRVAVDTALRSTSHPNIFAAGDVSACMDHAPANRGAPNSQDGSALAHNLAAAVAGNVQASRPVKADRLMLLACGDRYAVGSWGRYSFEGRWVWRLKDRLDRQLVAQYQSGE